MILSEIFKNTKYRDIEILRFKNDYPTLPTTASKCSAALQEGDEILMVNNVFIRGKTVDQVCELLSQMQGTLTFVIAKSGHPPPPKEPAKLNANSNVQRKSSTSSHDSANSFPNCKVIHYKAFFDYNPAEDLYIPCRELGVSFRRGDLLHIIDSSDDHWWQAFKVSFDFFV